MNAPFIGFGLGHFEEISNIIDLTRPVEIIKNEENNQWVISQDEKEICRTDYLCLNGCTLGKTINGYLCDPRETDSDKFHWETLKHNKEKNTFSHLNKEITRATFVDMMATDDTAPILAIGAE